VVGRGGFSRGSGYGVTGNGCHQQQQQQQQEGVVRGNGVVVEMAAVGSSGMRVQRSSSSSSNSVGSGKGEEDGQVAVTSGVGGKESRRVSRLARASSYLDSTS
jgi:hypothetical protein